MAPGVAETLQQVIGVCTANDPDVLVEGSGFAVVQQIDSDLTEYWISCDEALYEQAINYMLTMGIDSITFPPEPELVVPDEVI